MPTREPDPKRKKNESDDRFTWRKAVEMGLYLRHREQYAEADPYFRQAIELAPKAFPHNRIQVAIAYETCAANLRLLERSDEAALYKAEGQRIRAGGRVSVTPEPERESSHEPEPQRELPPPPISVSPAKGLKGFHPIVALATLKASLVHLEYFLKWESVDSAWITRRECWLGEVCMSPRLFDVAECLVDLELSLLWDSFDEPWQKARVDWLDVCAQAALVGDLSAALLKIESHLLPTAFRDEWNVNRHFWRSQVQRSTEESESLLRPVAR